MLGAFTGAPCAAKGILPGGIISGTIHLAIVAVAIVLALLQTTPPPAEPPPDAPVAVTLYETLPPPPPPAAARKKKKSRRKTKRKVAKKTVQKVEVQQAEAPPDPPEHEEPVVPDTPDVPDTPPGQEGGQAGGKAGGVVGGDATSKGGGTQVLSFGKGMTRPVLKQKVPFAFSQQAREAGVSGRVIARCVITAKGKVTGCRLIKKLHRFVDSDIIKSLQKRTYTPAKFQGRAVSVRYTIPVRISVR